MQKGIGFLIFYKCFYRGPIRNNRVGEAVPLDPGRIKGYRCQIQQSVNCFERLQATFRPVEIIASEKLQMAVNGVDFSVPLFRVSSQIGCQRGGIVFGRFKCALLLSFFNYIDKCVQAF